VSIPSRRWQVLGHVVELMRHVAHRVQQGPVGSVAEGAVLDGQQARLNCMRMFLAQSMAS